MPKNELPEKPVTGYINNSRQLSLPHVYKKIIIVIVCVALLIVGIGGLFVYKNYQSTHSTTDCSKSTKCKELLKEAIKSLAPKEVAGLAKSVDKIKGFKGYEKNPDLLYVLVTFYINLSDGINARKYLDMLKSVYNSKKGYDPLLYEAGIAVKKPSDLESIASFLQKQQQLQQHTNGYFYGIPPR